MPARTVGLVADSAAGALDDVDGTGPVSVASARHRTAILLRAVRMTLTLGCLPRRTISVHGVRGAPHRSFFAQTRHLRQLLCCTNKVGTLVHRPSGKASRDCPSRPKETGSRASSNLPAESNTWYVALYFVHVRRSHTTHASKYDVANKLQTRKLRGGPYFRYCT